MAIADLAPGQHATTVRDHWWWRPGWRVGRRFYALHCTFEGQTDLHRCADAYRRALRTTPALTLVPDEWLHLTLQGVGFCDEIPTPTLRAVTREVANTLDLAAPVDANTAEIVVADEALACPLVPAEPLQHLRASIRAALGRILGDDLVPGRYRPHVSIGYTTAAGSAEPYLTALRDTSPAPAAIRIEEVSLIRMHRDHRLYEWETVNRIPLRGTPEQPRPDGGESRGC